MGAEIWVPLAISAASAAATVAVSEATKPDAPDAPPVGDDPGAVPDADEAALRRRMRLRRGREALRIETEGGQAPTQPSTGLQIPT